MSNPDHRTKRKARLSASSSLSADAKLSTESPRVMPFDSKGRTASPVSSPIERMRHSELSASHPAPKRLGSPLPRQLRPGTPQPGTRTPSPTRGLDTIEHYLLRAAEMLLDADYVLIAAGAGFSADSGLKVYKDIADIEAYRRLKLTYADLCTPDLLQRDPEMFFGFWGSCFNDYMQTDPHGGYHICKEWRETHMRRSSGKHRIEGPVPDEAAHRDLDALDDVAPRMQRLSLSESQRRGEMRRESPQALAAKRRVAAAGQGPKREGKTCEMFVYTSNVDVAFERVGFPAHSVFEIHGNVCDWQCANPDKCREDTWRLPPTHRFIVDNARMRAPRWAAYPPLLPPPAPHSKEEVKKQGRARRSQEEVDEPLPRQTVPPVPTSAGKAAPPGRARGLGANGHSAGLGDLPAALCDDTEACGGTGSDGDAAAASACTTHRSTSSLQLSSPPASRRQTPTPPPPSDHHGLGFSAYRRPTSASLVRQHSPRPVAREEAVEGSSGWRRQEEGRASAAGQEGVAGACSAAKVLNHVRCQGCGRAARPNVLMFDDEDWVESDSKAYCRFEKKALKALKEGGSSLVVIEGGCGKRVPTVRRNSEKLVKHGAKLIRINLDYPGCSRTAAHRTVSLEMTALRALEGIDMALQRLRGLS